MASWIKINKERIRVIFESISGLEIVCGVKLLLEKRKQQIKLKTKHTTTIKEDK